MNRRDKTKGGARATTPVRRPTTNAPSSAAVAPIVRGRVKPARGGGHLLIVPRCPYCRRRHVHGAPRGAETDRENRLSHCLDGGKPYRIVVGAEAIE